MSKKFKRKVTFPSITEWIKKISLPNSELFLTEDNSKYDRLKTLNKIIKLPYTPPNKFTINDIINQTEEFKKIYRKKMNSQCVFRLVPLLPNLPKIRKKGGTLKNNIKWYFKQKINHYNYRIEIVPRSNKILWASIFVVDNHGILGEIIKGGLSQLVKGVYNQPPIIFSYNFKNWKFSQKNKRIEKILKTAINKITVTKLTVKNRLKKELRAQFTKNDIIRGYFEFTIWPKVGIKFIDYNRLQANILKRNNVWKKIDTEYNVLAGICASPGTVSGQAKIILHPHKEKFEKNDILISKNININYLPMIKMASAIITEKGNLLSHAAVICRELKKPYIAMVKNATKKINNGDNLLINANEGLVTKIK